MLGLAAIVGLWIGIAWIAGGPPWPWMVAAIVVALALGAVNTMAIHHYSTMHEGIRIVRKS